MKFLFGTLILMPSLLFAKPIGLVLSGGGAKGAYEVGVWKAMVETGVATNVRVISGTSVGALNAALFASVRDPVRIERLWMERIGELMGPIVDDMRDNVQSGLDAVADGMRLKKEFVEEGKQKLAKARGVPIEDLLPCEIEQIEKDASARVAIELGNRGLTGLLALREQRKKYSNNFCKALREELPNRWPAEAPRVYVTAQSKRKHNVTRFLLNEKTPERRVNEVAASCAIPKLFEPVTIDGVKYQDGGIGKGGDNTPIQPILENHAEIRTIVVVYLDDEKRLGKCRNRSEDNPGYKIVEIIPTQESKGLFGCIDPKVETLKRLVDLGYRDGLRALSHAKL